MSTTLNPNDISFSSLSNSLSDYTPTTEESGLNTTASSSIFNDNDYLGTGDEDKYYDVDEGESEINENYHDSKIRLSIISLRELPVTAQTDDLPSRLTITSMNDKSSEKTKFINYQSLKNITNDIYDYVQVVPDSDGVTKRKKPKDLFKRDKSVHKSKNVGKKRKKKVKILKASWRDESEKDKEVALKKVESLSVFDHNKSEMSGEDLEIMENINLLYKLSHHQSLLRIYGYTVDPSTLNHFLIVQYANGGNLRKFLREHHPELTWNDRLKFCKDLASGLKYIHDHDILHLALHSRNVLHHNRKLLISDLGISKSHVSTVSLILPYTDPQYLADIANYQQNKKSDIYALGILMHEISSGRIPYNEYLVKNDVAGEIRDGGERDLSVSYIPELSPKIVHEGYRQQPMYGTPPEYVTLYQQCWQMESTVRPSVDEVLARLDGIEVGPADVYEDSEKILKERNANEIEERAKGESNHWDINIKEYNEKSDKDHVIYVQDVGNNSGTESGSGLKSVYFSTDITSYPTDSMIYGLADEESGTRKKRFFTRRRIVFSIFICWLAVIVVGGCVMIGVFASSDK